MGVLKDYHGVSDISIEYDYKGLGYNSFVVDGVQYYAHDNCVHGNCYNVLEIEGNWLFGERYDSISLHGCIKDGECHAFDITMLSDNNDYHVVSCSQFEIGVL